MQSQRRFVKFMRTTYGFHTTAVQTVRSPLRQLTVNVTCLRQSKESTYSVIIKLGNKQRDYVTANYSVTLKLRVNNAIII